MSFHHGVVNLIFLIPYNSSHKGGVSARFQTRKFDSFSWTGVHTKPVFGPRGSAGAEGHSGPQLWTTGPRRPFSEWVSLFLS